MASSRNLEQAIQAYQRGNFDEAKRLFKFALKTDPLSHQERIQALVFLAECDSNPQFKVEQYQQAIQLDPSNQDVLQRLNYWSQQANAQATQQGNTPSQGMPAINPQQQQFQQGFTPTGGMPPVNPQQGYNQQAWQNPQQQQFQQGLTPSQGMPAINPQQQQFQQGFTPTGGMPPVNSQQSFNQNFTTDSMPAIQQTAFNHQAAYGQAAPIQLSQVQRSVGVIGGPNGRGTGFFVTRDGLVATTRYVVGGEEILRIELLGGQQIEGRLVRSFPDLDLAFIQTNVQLAHLMAISQSPVLADNSQLLAVTHSGEGLRTSKRATKNAIAQHWFPTMINHLLDAGGNPVFLGGQNTLVGMLTKNASRSNTYMYGLHIHKIYQMIDLYLQEKQQNLGQSTAYCNACGSSSRAPSFGGFFCETCGNTLPYALEINRYPQPNLSGLYGENMQRPCPNCASQVGFYNGKCLRCSFAL